MSDLATLHELAQRLCLPRDWLRHEADAGRIPCLKIERRYRFNVEAVREALAGRAAVSVANSSEGNELNETRPVLAETGQDIGANDAGPER